MPDPLRPATAHIQEVPFTNITGVGACGEGERALWATVGSKLQGEVRGDHLPRQGLGLQQGGTRSTQIWVCFGGGCAWQMSPKFLRPRQCSGRRGCCFPDQEARGMDSGGNGCAERGGRHPGQLREGWG